METTRHALDTVDDTFERRSAGVAEPDYVYWLDRNEIDVMTARCHIRLGAPAAAEPLSGQALAGYDHGHTRETAINQTWVADGHARTAT